MTVYKVVRLTKDGRLVSFAMSEYRRLTSDVVLEYKLFEETKPVIGKIFCFKKFSDAEEFVKEQGWYLAKRGRVYILIGEGRKSRRQRYIFPMAYSHPKLIKEFWKSYGQDLSYVYVAGRAPEGTVLVDSFTPKTISCRVSL